LLGLLDRAAWAEDSADGLVKDVLETLLCEGRALEVLDGVDFLCHLETHRVGDGLHALLLELVDGVAVLTQIELGAREDDGGVSSVVRNLGIPLGANVVERGRVHQREADEENVGLRVRQRSETVVIFLTGGIPQTQVDGLSVHHDVCRVVVEHRGDVFSGERIGGVGNEKARLADGTVTNNDTFDGLHCLCGRKQETS